MDEIQKHIEELLASADTLALAEREKPIEESLGEIERAIYKLKAEREKAPERARSISVMLRSFEELREGYLALAKEEGEDVLSVPEIRQWANSTKEREPEMAAVEA